MKSVVLGLAALTMIGFNPAAKADLAAVGAVNPVTGLPAFFQDQSGQQIQFCDIVNTTIIPNGGNAGAIANGPPCPALELVDPGVPGGDPGPGVTEANLVEGFFYVAEGVIQPVTGEKFLVRMEVEGAGGVVLHDVRIRLRNMVQTGTYIVDTPFGSTSIAVANAADNVDTLLPGGGTGAPPDFATALHGPFSCFWSNGTGNLVVVPGHTFLGDFTTEAPLIPQAPCTQTAADLVARVTLPDGTVTETNLWTVQAELFPGTGIIPKRTTYERTADATVARIDSFVQSVPGAIIHITSPNLPNNLTYVEEPTAPGGFYIRRNFQGTPPVVPTTVTIEGSTVALTDRVNITIARYNVGTDRLQVSAASSDLSANPTLTAFDQHGQTLGVLTAGVLDITPGLTVPPAIVTVRSSLGGSENATTQILGGNQIGQ
jgi:hypothetical protein